MNITMLKLSSSETEEDNLENLDFKVVTCFIEFENKFLFLQRARKDSQHKLWGIPGGKLDADETIRSALKRELFEELNLLFNENSFLFLSKGLSNNPYDGKYLLYLYYLSLDSYPKITLNAEEHYKYKWIDIENLDKINLLVSQGRAIDLVKNKLKDLIYNKIL